jgi:hypothetical protein
MSNDYKCLLAALTACLAPVFGHAGPIGEPAAPLVVKEWIKGQPVEVKPGTNIFVVEIFATTGLASRASITNLNSVQRRLKDWGVVVAGISDEPAEKIRGFVEQHGANIEYAIGVDDRRQTSLAYMLAARQQGVPHVFVVGKDGKLLWHGHPLHGLDRTLDEIIAGRFNVEQAAKADLARTQMEQYLALARRNDLRTREAGLRMLEFRTNDVSQLCELAFLIATDSAITKRDFQLAYAAVDRAEKLAPTNSTRVEVTRAVLLFEAGNKEEGLARARKAATAAKEPDEKANAESCLRTMEARLAAARANPTNPPPSKP